MGEKVDPGRLDEAPARARSSRRGPSTSRSPRPRPGSLNDIRALNEVARAHDSVLCVDAVSGLGAVDLPQDEWGVDVVVAGSQKSLMCPPGLAFASVSDRAMALAAESPRGRYYLDWQRTATGQKEEPPNSAFTPAVTLFRALDVALELIFEEGLDAVYARHALLARAARAGVEALGLERFGPDDENANVVTVARLPDDIDGAKVPKLMRDGYGVTIAGGQGHLKGRIATIAHCGYYGAFDIVIALTALEMALRDLGHDAEPGAGVAGGAAGLRRGRPRPGARRLVASADGKPRVLVKEKIADSGVALLREDFDVELGLDMSDDELSERIGEFDAIVIRSATKLHLGPDRARLRASRSSGRAGTGVDNVDVDAATKRGIVVVNAPESNSVAAAEHTLALALALCRNVPQAHASLLAGEWARSSFAGNELYGKTLGVIGFGRIGQLVAKRAQAFEMEVVAFDKFVAAERFRELGVERAETTDELYAQAPTSSRSTSRRRRTRSTGSTPRRSRR